MFSHISGHPILDLINTVEWRLSDVRREEELVTYAHVVQWCLEAGLLTEDEQTHCKDLADKDSGLAEFERQAIIGLREATYAALFGHDTAASQVADAYREAIDAAQLVRSGSGWSWLVETLDMHTPRHRLALGLMELFGREDLDRLHQCEDEVCGWVYLDTSPRHNRRWCVTNDCGDRNRARAYYARQKAKQKT